MLTGADLGCSDWLREMGQAPLGAIVAAISRRLCRLLARQRCSEWVDWPPLKAMELVLLHVVLLQVKRDRVLLQAAARSCCARVASCSFGVRQGACKVYSAGKQLPLSRSMVCSAARAIPS